MDHGYIQEHQVVSRYVTGKLEPADRAQFEEHMIDCRQCLDELELTDDFRDTLRQVVAENESRASATAPWLPGFMARRRTAVLTAAALAFAGLAALVFLGQSRSARELARMRTASADWERRYANEQQARKAAESQLQETLAQATAPLFALNLTRGADSATAEPSTVVAISPSAKSVALSLEWHNDPDFQSYRAMLSDAAGRRVWSVDHIPPPSSGALAITLPAGLFPSGKYLLTVEGEITGRYSVVGRYSFRATSAK